MRARLLDMGEVSAARSQSIYHAVAATIRANDSPVAVVNRVASSLVSIGVDREPAEEIDLDFCLENRVPVLRRLLGGPAQLIGNNQLLFRFLVSTDTATSLRPVTPTPLANTCIALGLPSQIGPSGEILVGKPPEPLRQVGSCQTGTVAGAECLTAFLSRDPEPIRREVILRISRGTENLGHPPTSLARELPERPDFATVAETLLLEVEKDLGIELVPSMPTPDEMDAIYEWDERLVFDLESAVEDANSKNNQLAC